MAAADEVEKMESEYADYDISTKGLIEDIEAAEMGNTKRIENKELEDEPIQWLEEKLASINEEFSRKIWFTLIPEDNEGEQNDADTNDKGAKREVDAHDNSNNYDEYGMNSNGKVN